MKSGGKPLGLVRTQAGEQAPARTLAKLQENLGGRFSTKARTASWWSAVWWAMAW
jgi:hypothetical protein